MGLDGVELVMRAEETFGITVTDADAERILTVGDLYRYVLAKLEHVGGRPCRSAGAFRELRRALKEGPGVDRRSVHPDTRLEDLLPRATRPRDWARLRLALGRDLPGLRRPAWARWVVGAAWLALAATLLWVCVFPPAGPGVTLAVVAAGLAAVPLALAATAPWKREVPASHATVRSAVAAFLADGWAPAAAARHGWNRGDVWLAVQGLVVDQLGARPEDVTEDARFVEDLGMD